MSDLNVLEEELSRILGLPVFSQLTGGAKLQLRIEGLERPHGLSVTLRPMLSWVDATLEFDSLAKTLRDHVASAFVEKRDQVQVLIDSFSSLGARYSDETHSAMQSEEQPATIPLFSSRVMFDDVPTTSDAHRVAAASVLTLILELATVLEDPVAPGSPDVFDEEGTAKLQWSRRYERSRANRAVAIELHGTDCTVCGFSFSSFYGNLAKGYVEIHHLTPVSSMDGPRVVDPRTELVPLCANCHRAAHRRWPPFSPDELRREVLQGRQFP